MMPPRRLWAFTKYERMIFLRDLCACRFAEMPLHRTSESSHPPSFSAERHPDKSTRPPSGYFRADGMLKNVNTIEEYRALDRSSLIEQAGNMVSPWSTPNRASGV